MPVQRLDPRTALVLIDLQKGITKLARAFRERDLPVVRVAFSAVPAAGPGGYDRCDHRGAAIDRRDSP